MSRLKGGQTGCDKGGGSVALRDVTPVEFEQLTHIQLYNNGCISCNKCTGEDRANVGEEESAI